mgnify:CR=1 FL=1
MKQFKLPNKEVVYCIDRMTAKDVYQEIYEDNVYLRNNVTLKNGDVVFDVEANIGLFSKFVNDKYENLKVFAFEPIPQIFRVLNANLMNKSNIKFYNLGLSDQEQETEFYFYPKVSADSTSNPFNMENQINIYVEQYHKGILKALPKKLLRYLIAYKLRSIYRAIKITCPLKTISQIISENQVECIDLLKIDAENAERQVLAGIKDDDWNKISQVALEIHTTSPDGDTLIKDMCDLFDSKGFTYVLDTQSRFSFIGVHMLYAKNII